MTQCCKYCGVKDNNNNNTDHNGERRSSAKEKIGRINQEVGIKRKKDRNSCPFFRWLKHGSHSWSLEENIFTQKRTNLGYGWLSI